MQEVTPGHALAIGSPHVKPTAEVQVDWNGSGDPDQPYGQYTLDGDDAVTSVSIDRSYATSLPQELTYLQGNAVSSATVELAGDAAMDLSPFRTTSPLSSGRRMGRPAVIRAGMAGHEPLPLFTGSVRSVNPRSSSRTASVEFLDLPVEWRAAPVVPAYAGGGGWLNGQAYIDEMLRQTGTYTSPPPLAGAVLSVSMHGSANPQLGSLSTQFLFDPFIASPFVEGRFGMAMQGPVLPVENRLFYARYNPDGARLSFASGQRQQLQFWAKAPWVGNLPAYLYRVGPTELDADGVLDIRVIQDGRLGVTLSRKGQVPTAVYSAFPPSGSAAWHFYGIHIAWGATTATVTMQVNSTTTVQTISVGAYVAPTIAGDTPPSRVDAHATAIPAHESMQLAVGQAPDFTDSTWEGQATLEVSKLWLDATPPGEYATRWEVVTALAEAEFATAEFTEEGRFLYRTADRWAQVTEPDGFLTADAHLMDLAATESVDAVRNSIQVSRTILTNDPVEWNPPANPVFTTAIAARSEYSFVYDFEQPILSAKFVGPLSGGYVMVGTSQFGNASADDGGGSPGQYLAQAIVTQLGDTAVKVTIRNNSNYSRYLANNAVLQGMVFSATVDREAGVAEDAGSIVDYGLRPYSLPDSPWRQSQTSADLIAADLVRQLAQPLPILENVPTVGDPRRQLGDRLRVVDPDGLAVNRDYWLIGVRSQIGANGFTQDLTLRPTPNPAVVLPPDPGGGGGGTFNPATIPGLYRRWESEDLTGPDGASVTSWRDRIVGALATQSVLASQPRYRTTAFGGRPAVQFDGADWLSASITLGPAYTIAVVGRSLVAPSPGQVAGFLSADGDGERARLFQLRLVAANRAEFISFTKGASSSVYVPPSGGEEYGHYESRYSTNPIYAYGSRTVPAGSPMSLVGVRTATQATATLLGSSEGPTAAASGATITRPMAIGRSYGPPNAIAEGAGFLTGFISAIYIWPRALTTAELSTLNAGLAVLHNLPA